MGLKRFAVQNKGMSQDVSISKETQEFAFKNYNIRIQATDDNTLLSVTNIKGPKQYAYHYLNGVTHNSYFKDLIIGGNGTIVGHCIAGDYLVIFITNIPDVVHPGATFDEILRLEPTDATYNFGTEQRPDFWPIVDVKVLAKGNLNFHLDKKINALYYYESQKVQKVYWVDGWYSDKEIENDSNKVNNFPRVINILREDIANSVDAIQALSIFPPIGNPPTIEVEKLYSQPSQLPAGVIQYFVSYYNYNAAETSIVQTTPLYSIDFSNRGASPEETGSCAFQLTISGLNDKYDFVRVYSACRTSQDAEPIVSIVGDYAIGSSTSVTLIDNGINQENVDPTMLYYIGGSALYATTITQKDNTAFYGNIKDAAIYFTDSEIAALESAFHYDLENDTDGSGICTSKILEVSTKNIATDYILHQYYPYNRQQGNSTTFKSGEIYRFAIQFQNAFGAWSQPIWCGDLKFPYIHHYVSDVEYNVNAIRVINNIESISSISNILTNKQIKNYRILMADASISNGRSIVTQGLVNPTMFNVVQRTANSPWTLPSWIMRLSDSKKYPNYHLEPINDAAVDNAEISTYFNKTGHYTSPCYQTFDESEGRKYELFLLGMNTPQADSPFSINIIKYSFDLPDANPDYILYNFYNLTTDTGPNGEPTYENLTAELIHIETPWNTDVDTTIHDSYDRYKTYVLSQGHTPMDEEGFTFYAKTHTYDPLLYQMARDLIGWRGQTQPNHTGWSPWSSAVSIIYDSYRLQTMGYGNYINDYKLYHPVMSSSILGNQTSDYDIDYQIRGAMQYGWVQLTVEQHSLQDLFKNSAETAASIIGNYTLQFPFSLNPSNFGISDFSSLYWIAYGSTKDKRYHTQEDDNAYYLDSSIVTLNSPDIDVDSTITNKKRLNFRIINALKLKTNYPQVEIKTHTAAYFDLWKPLNDKISKYFILNGASSSTDYCCLSDYLYDDGKYSYYGDGNGDGIAEWQISNSAMDSYKVYLWHSAGSISGIDKIQLHNSDLTEPWPSILQRKTIFNQRVMIEDGYPTNTIAKPTTGDSNIDAIIQAIPEDVWKSKAINYGQVYSQIFTNENAIGAINTQLLYYGDYDNVISAQNVPIFSEQYPTIKDWNASELKEVPIASIKTTRIKFKTTNHAVFELKADNKKLTLPQGNALNSNNQIQPLLYFTGTINNWYRYGKYKLFNESDEAIYSDRMQYDLQRYVGVPESDLYLTADWARKIGITDNLKNYYESPIHYYFNNLSSASDVLNLLTGNKIEYPCVFVGELFYDLNYKTELYGGINKEAINKLTWLPCSEIAILSVAPTNFIGDTYYQMYDCLKSYPAVEEDMDNNVVDITSAMLETHYNLDGRYDNNRANFNIMSRPSNFNLYNLVYSQKNNLFQYSMFDAKLYSSEYPTQVTWTMVKNYLGKVDTWTNPLQVNSAYANNKITQLLNFNSNIWALTEHSLDIISYNNKNLIETKAGEPIEVANSGKVEKVHTLSLPFGTHNQTYQITEKGLYFVEDNENSIIRINQDVSYTKIGLNKMDSWMKNNIIQGTFTPSLLTNNVKKPLPLHLEYDPIHKDLYIIINGDDSIEENCLIYNETLDAFTSFVSCGKMYNLFVNNGQLYSIGNIVNPQVYKMFAGIYNTTYDEAPINYYMQFRLNPAPYSDKTFTNVEFNADVNTSEYLNENERTLSLVSPFTHIQAWNEYQNSGLVPLQKTYANPLVNNVPKFRTWRALIPRDGIDKERKRNPYGLNRIRNPWIHLKLFNEVPKDKNENKLENYKMEFHNMVVQYLE